jgi:hypothetical protein
MPTTIAAVAPNAGAWSRVGLSSFLRNPDFVAVSTFAAIGVLITISFVLCVPNEQAALSIQALSF